MNNTTPVLVTLRSTNNLRDEAIRYGFMKATQYFCIVLLFISAVGLTRYQFKPYWFDALWYTYLLGGAFSSIGLAFLFVNPPEYPHFPRISLEELEKMKEIGIPESVQKTTEDNVLIGSFAELNAMKITDSFLQRLQSSSGKNNTN